MIAPKDGGPAYPSRPGMIFYIPKEHEEEVKETVERMDRRFAGMSLLDYFAARVATGIMAGKSEMTAEGVAHLSYSIAKAMIEEKNKLEGGWDKEGGNG